MSLRLKMLIPLLLIFMLFASFLHLYWRPILLEYEKAEIIKREQEKLLSLEPNLLRNLLEGDLGALYTNLDWFRESKTDVAYQVELFNTQGKRIYPLTPVKAVALPYVTEIKQLLEIDQHKLGTLLVKVNWKNRYLETEYNIWTFELMALFLFGFALLTVLAFQEWLIRRPLVAMKNASLQLSKGHFEVNLPTAARDEVGELARAFDRMRISLLQTQQDLGNKAAEASDNAIRFRTVLESMPAALITINKVGAINDFNWAAEEMFGYDANEIVGQNIINLLPETQHSNDLIGSIKEITKKTLLSNEFSDEYEGKRKNGSLFPMHLFHSIMQLGSNTYSVIIAFDISDNKEKERQLLASKIQAEQANLAKSEFLANMSHELRTPMHGILSFSNIALRNADKLNLEKAMQYFSYIKTSGDRLLTLLNDLLDLAKLESGKMEMNFSVNKLETAAKACIAEQQARLVEMNKKVIWNPQSIAGKAVFDSERITQVITNILSNAIKFTPDGENINLSIATAQLESANGVQIPALSFKLRDHGAGIPGGECEQIFDKFLQSSTTKTKAGGTGLGLSICRQIINAHSGKIWAENHPSGGAVFQFIIPVELPHQDDVIR